MNFGCGSQRFDCLPRVFFSCSDDDEEDLQAAVKTSTNGSSYRSLRKKKTQKSVETSCDFRFIPKRGQEAKIPVLGERALH